MRETVDSPGWYSERDVEPIDIIESVVEGLPPARAYSLGQVLRYCLRAGRKDDIEIDLGKANNYAHRLVYGTWRNGMEYIEIISLDSAKRVMRHIFYQCSDRADAERLLKTLGFSPNPPKPWRNKLGHRAWIVPGRVPDSHDIPNDGWVHLFRKEE